MNMKNDCKTLWNYLKDAFEMEELVEGFSTIGGFEYEAQNISDELIDSLNEDQVRSLFFDIGYMAVNELFGGDFGTWYDVLESLGFEEGTIELLDY